MFNNMWDVIEPKHYSKRVGREVPGVVAVLCVVDTGPMLIAVTTITEMVILYKYVEINQSISSRFEIVNEEYIEELKDKSENKNTKNNTEW